MKTEIVVLSALLALVTTFTYFRMRVPFGCELEFPEDWSEEEKASFVDSYMGVFVSLVQWTTVMIVVATTVFVAAKQYQQSRRNRSKRDT